MKHSIEKPDCKELYFVLEKSFISFYCCVSLTIVFSRFLEILQAESLEMEHSSKRLGCVIIKSFLCLSC